MKKLILFDMDGVIFKKENFWFELHKAYGTFDEGLEITKKYGRTDYETLVKEVVGRLWKGKPADAYFSLIKNAQYVRGIKETIEILKSKGYKTALISTGPRDLAIRAQKELGLDYVYANHLMTENGIVTGSTDMRNWPLRWDNKAEIMRQICREHNLYYKDCIMVGNGENDIKMARTAGFAIAFCAEDEELKKYSNAIIDEEDLSLILKSIEEFENRQLII